MASQAITCHHLFVSMASIAVKLRNIKIIVKKGKRLSAKLCAGLNSVSCVNDAPKFRFDASNFTLTRHGDAFFHLLYLMYSIFHVLREKNIYYYYFIGLLAL